MTETNLPALQKKSGQLIARLWSGIVQSFERLAHWLAAGTRGEKIALLLLVVGLPCLVFYNLDLNPRPWHDEGAALILARTLAEDGVYAMRNSGGYQTFGPVQSVGPTVILPVALVYRLFGAGLLQGRVVVALYTLLALLLFYRVGRRLFDRSTAILGLLFLLAAPAVRILVYGREVLGEVPGLAFFLAGWLALASALTGALKSRRLGWAVLAGLLLGAAIVTKSSYLVMIPATLGLVAVLDLIYYRQGAWKYLALITLLALACYFAWQVWQIGYYGSASYRTDLAKLGQLAAITTGFHLRTAISGLRGILGSDSGNFYMYWGFLAVGYLLWLAAQKNLKGLLQASIAIFTCLWLLYYTFWIIAWQHYALSAMALLALLVANLYISLARAAAPVIGDYLRRPPYSAAPPLQVVLAFGTLVGLVSYGLWAGYNLQQYIRSDVLDRSGADSADLRSQPQLLNPRIVAEYLEQNTSSGEVIETWERELGILTDLTYHYPDQSMLINTHAAVYRGNNAHYLLGEEYFQRIHPAYVVIGWFARAFPVYDMKYLLANSELIKTIGNGFDNYQIYRLNH